MIPRRTLLSGLLGTAAAAAVGTEAEGKPFRNPKSSPTPSPTPSGESVPIPGVTASSSSGTSSPTYTLISSNADGYTVASPISDGDMHDFIGANYGSTSNFVRTNVVAETGHGNVVSQHFPADLHDGIALTGCPLSRAVDEATIEYDVRFKSTGTVTTGALGALVRGNPWGLGGKLPGLGGKLPSAGGNPPTGNSPSPQGWSGRFMWITPSAGFGSESPQAPAEIIGYVYWPTQTPGTSGSNKRTGVPIVADTWYHIKQRYVMNSINVEGTSGNSDGIHQIWIDGTLRYQTTTQVWRIYEAARITHFVYDLFYGGPDDTWATTNDADVQVDNLLVETPIPPPPPAEVAPLKTGFEGTTSGATMDATAANQNSPTNDLLTLNTFVGSPTRQYVSADVCNGTRALRVTGAASSTWRFYYPYTQSTSFAMRTGFVLKAAPSTEQEIFYLVEGTSFAAALALRLTASRQLKIFNRAAGSSTYSGFTASLDTPYRIEVYGTLDDSPTTTNGTVAVKVFAGNSTTASGTVFTSIAYNLGTVGFVRQQWGKLTSSGTLDIVFDDLAARFGSATPIGPAA